MKMGATDSRFAMPHLRSKFASEWRYAIFVHSVSVEACEALRMNVGHVALLAMANLFVKSSVRFRRLLVVLQKATLKFTLKTTFKSSHGIQFLESTSSERNVYRH